MIWRLLVIPIVGGSVFGFAVGMLIAYAEGLL